MSFLLFRARTENATLFAVGVRGHRSDAFRKTQIRQLLALEFVFFSGMEGPGASLPLSWRTRKGVPLFKAETCKFSACADSKNLPRPRQF